MAVKKVYVVTAGVYSDYRIDRVFSEEKIAEAFVEKMNDAKYADPYRVEEFILDDKLPFPLDMFIFRVEMWLNSGDIVDIIKVQDAPRLNHGSVIREGKHFLIYVIAKDEKHAVKISNEKRAMFLSSVC